MKNVRTWKTMILTGAFITLAATTIGCNNNSVTISGAGSSPLSSAIDTGATSGPQLDVVWVIDDSASMAEEQYQIINGLSKFITTIDQLKLDTHIAITSTNAPSMKQTTTPDKQNLPSGTFFKKAWGDIYQTAKNKMSEQGFKDFYNTAWACAGKPLPFTEDVALNNFKTNNMSGLFPTSYPEVAPKGYLSTSDYAKDPVTGFLTDLGKSKLIQDFKCLSLVGLGGNYVEKGISAAVNAVDPKGPNKAILGTPTKEGFIRKNAKFSLIIVSDENDCSNHPVKYKTANNKDLTLNIGGYSNTETACPQLCVLFNTKEGLPPGFPQLLDDPHKSADTLVKHLQAIKGKDSTFTKQDVVAMTISGPNIPETTDTTPLKFTPPNWGNLNPSELKTVSDYIAENLFKPTSTNCGQNPIHVPPSFTYPAITSSPAKNFAACTSEKFGSSTSSDRYVRFVTSFPLSYPATDALDKSGLLCGADFNDAWKTLSSMIQKVTVNRCLPTKQIKGACASKSTGATCGDGKGTCKLIPASTDKYCSSLIQLVLVANSANANKLKNATDGSKPYCKPGTYGKIPNEPYSCILDESFYKFEPCFQGMEFTYKDPTNAEAALSGIKTEVRYTAIN